MKHFTTNRFLTYSHYRFENGAQIVKVKTSGYTDDLLSIVADDNNNYLDSALERVKKSLTSYMRIVTGGLDTSDVVVSVTQFTPQHELFKFNLRIILDLFHSVKYERDFKFPMGCDFNAVIDEAMTGFIADANKYFNSLVTKEYVDDIAEVINLIDKNELYKGTHLT